MARKNVPLMLRVERGPRYRELFHLQEKSTIGTNHDSLVQFDASEANAHLPPQANAKLHLLPVHVTIERRDGSFWVKSHAGEKNPLQVRLLEGKSVLLGLPPNTERELVPGQVLEIGPEGNDKTIRLKVIANSGWRGLWAKISSEKPGRFHHH